MLRKGANPNSTNSEKSTPMHIILKRFEEYSNSNIDFWITFLLKRGANSNLADKNGFTPLHVLCQYCLVEDPDTIKKFFELHEKFDRRIEVDARDNNKRTPLQWAIASHWPETVKFLLDRGADLRIFVFPTESHFDESRFGAIYDRDWVRHRLSLAASALFIVELLENRGYEMKQNDATTIMTIFNRWGLFDQPDIVDKRWYVRDERFVDKAKKIMNNSSRILQSYLRPLVVHAEQLEWISKRERPALPGAAAHILHVVIYSFETCRLFFYAFTGTPARRQEIKLNFVPRVRKLATRIKYDDNDSSKSTRAISLMKYYISQYW
uniref:Uncharacterized protein n=1 Tax=Trichogramma kaykai TaxID=54128 RepID=A0ABD2WMT5_9HYME